MQWSRRTISSQTTDGVDLLGTHMFPAEGTHYAFVFDNNGDFHDPGVNDVREYWWREPGPVGSGDLLSGGAPQIMGGGATSNTFASHVFQAEQTQHVFYIADADRHIWELWWGGSEKPRGGDLMAEITGAPIAEMDLCSHVVEVEGTQHVFYPDEHGHINELWWHPTDRPTREDLTARSHAASVASAGFGLCSHVDADSTQYVFLVSDGQIIELSKAISSDWTSRNLTAVSLGNPPLSVSAPTSHAVSDGTQHVFYVAANGDIIELWWAGVQKPHAENLTMQSHSPPATRFTGVDPRFPAALPVASHFVRTEGTQHVFYGTDTGAVREIWWKDADPKHAEDVTALAGAPPMRAFRRVSSHVSDADGTQHVVYLGSDNELHALLARP